jgi:hypothetical protein
MVIGVQHDLHGVSPKSIRGGKHRASIRRLTGVALRANIAHRSYERPLIKGGAMSGTDLFR